MNTISDIDDILSVQLTDMAGRKITYIEANKENNFLPMPNDNLKADIAYIGFFMMNLKSQGKQIGSAIISEAIDYLKSIGKTSVRLAIDKGNPQSTHFWKKNGFEIISEADVNGWTKLVAEKILTV